MTRSFPCPRPAKYQTGREWFSAARRCCGVDRGFRVTIGRVEYELPPSDIKRAAEFF